MSEFPRTLKHVTLWLLLGTAVFLAVQAWQSAQRRARVTVADGVIRLERGPDGHFHWRGRIQGRSIDFLVDTGATRTALPLALAEALGLPRGEVVRSATAGGVAEGFQTRVDIELEGGVRAERLPVTVLPALGSPLLGMDVLGRLSFTQSGGVLTLAPPRP